MVAVNVDAIRDVDEAIKRLQHDRLIALDIETGGLDPWKDPIAVVSLHGATSSQTAVLHVRGRIPRPLEDFLSDEGKTFVGHNVGGFDALFLAENGVDVWAPRWYDTMVGEAALMTSGRRDFSVSLKNTIQRRLGKKISKEQQVSAWMAETLTPEQVKYCVDDVRLLPDLYNEQLTRAGGSSMRQALDVEMQVLPVVMSMSMNGLPIGEEQFRAYITKQSADFKRTQGELFAIFGREINMNSPAQLKKALHDIGAPVEDTTAETLMWLYEISGDQRLRTLLKCKFAGQRLKVYSDDWLKQYAWDWQVRSRFWQCGTETGRFSSSNPNLQQIPRDMRPVFGWRPGWKMIWADYSQIEVRIAAKIARDKVMLQAVEHEDTHRAVAALVFQKTPEDITSEERKLSKAMTFTLLFGGSANRLYEYARLNGSKITPADASNMYDAFFHRFVGLHRMRVKAQGLARDWGPLTLTLPTGMRRVLAGQQKTPTRILNTSVQGTAAAGMKYALIECAKRDLTQYLGCTVHDELVACVPEDMAEEYARELTEAMTVGMLKAIDIPVKVETEIADAWSLDSANPPSWLTASTS